MGAPPKNGHLRDAAGRFRLRRFGFKVDSPKPFGLQNFVEQSKKPPVTDPSTTPTPDAKKET